MRLGDYLRRFRPVGTPGAAAPAGVPSDVDAEQAAELAPVFAALEGTREEAARIRSEAEQEARRIADEATSAIEAIESDGRRRMAEVRAQVATERTRLADDEGERLLAEANDEASRVERTAATRRPAMVDRVVDTVLGGPAPGVEKGRRTR